MYDRLSGRVASWDLLHWNTLWIALHIIGIAIFFYAFPRHHDDLWFLDKFSDYLKAQGIVALERDPDLTANPFPFQEIIETWRYHYTFDNARFSNTLVVPFLLLPIWIPQTLSLLCWAYCVFGSLRIAGMNWRRSPLVPYAIFAWSVLLGWHDGLSAVTFQFNYVLPSALTVCLIGLLFRHNVHNRLPKLMLAGFFLGWFHEGFSLPMIVGLGILMILWKRYRTKYFCTALLTLCAGLSIILLSPGFTSRMTVNATGDGFGIHNIPAMISVNISLFCYLGALLIFIFRRKNISILRNPLIVLTLVACVASYIICCEVNFAPRIGWINTLLSIIGFLFVVKRLYPTLDNKYSKRQCAIASLLLICSYIYIGAVDYYSIEIRKDWNHCISQYLNNPDKTAYGKVFSSEKLPIVLKGLPSPLFYTQNVRMINQYIIEQDDRPFHIVPEELRTITEAKETPLEGGDGFRIYQDRIYRRWTEDFNPPNNAILSIEIQCDFGKGYITRPAYATAFKSEADGNWYHYINIQSGMSQAFSRRPVGVRFTKH